MPEGNKKKSTQDYFGYGKAGKLSGIEENCNSRIFADTRFSPGNMIQGIILKQNQVKDSIERCEKPEEIALEEFLNNEYKDGKSTEYLVDGAILTCTNCTKKDIYIKDGMIEYLYTVAEEKLGEKIDTTSIDGWDNDKVAGKLIVTENPTAEITGLKQATVADCIGKDRENPNAKYNIPFFGNCKRETYNEQEMAVFRKIHSEENSGFAKRKEGSCKYLMKLESEWENFNLCQNYFSFDDDEEGNKQGITMTSILFCRCGGFVYPVTSGQVISYPAYTGFQFTKQQLIYCGWEDVSDVEVEQFNSALKKFGVNSKDSALILLATMLSESSNCAVVLEGEREDKKIKYDNDVTWNEYKNTMAASGMPINYNWTERGAGYIQITWREKQLEFLMAMGDDYDGENTAQHIANNYPIEASVWYWTNQSLTGAGNLNAYIEKNGASDEIFLITQYFVNGYKYGIDSVLRNIKEGEITYEIVKGNNDEDNGKLIVGDEEYELPNGWENREKAWKKVKELLNEE